MPSKFNKIKVDKAGRSEWIPVNNFDIYGKSTIVVKITGTALVTVEMTISEYKNNPIPFDHELLDDIVESSVATIDYPISYIRLNVKELIKGDVQLEFRYFTK